MLAWWLRNPPIPYGGDARRASAISADSATSDDAAAIRGSAITAAIRAVSSTEVRLTEIAESALGAPADPEAAFEYLKAITRSPETGVLVQDGASPLAWAGQLRVTPTVGAAGTIVRFTPFYTTLEVVAVRGARRAMATALIHATPPADRVATALDATIEARRFVESFRFASVGDTAAGELVRDRSGRPLMRVDAIPRTAESVRFAEVASARGRGVVLLGVGILILIGFGWSDRRSLGLRLSTVATALVAIALVPWNNFSNFARAFDPAYFYSPVGGPFTASAGVFTMSGALMVMSVIALIRAKRVRISRYLAAALSVLAGAGGAALAGIVARGMVLPPWGAPMALWLEWEVPLFLALFAAWLAALWLVMMAIGSRPMVTLKSATLVAIVAGSVATFTVWTTATEQRLQLSMRDVAGLQRADPDAALLVSRFGTQLAAYESAGTRADVLKRYALSDLAPAEVQVSLGTWSSAAVQTSRLDLARLPYDSAALSAVVREARSAGLPIIRQTLGPVGRQVLMAVPHGDGQVTSTVASPRTRLVAQDPYAPLLGFEQPEQSDQPYTLSLADVIPGGTAKRGTMTWRRNGDEWHGDEVIATSRGLARAHVEVDLRTWPTRLVRASLIVTLNIAIVAFLWALSAMSEGGFLRWLRRRGSGWLRSYRGRLTLALFAFFVVPAVAFAGWSFQRLRGEDRDVRGLLVREDLQPTPEGDPLQHQRDHGLGETPLFLYSNAVLTSSSDSLYEMIAPAGRMLPRPVQLSISDAGELDASWQQRVAGSRIFWGFRAGSSASRGNYILAAPARRDELVLDRRRRDLTLLLLFATAMGGIAAFWLSGIAARILARDLELSRIEVARAERILAWGEMARQVAHEIKNPLTPIRLGVQHLRRARADARIDYDKVLDENVTRILSEIDRLDEIARAFSRYGSAPADLPAPERIDVAAILRDVVGLERIGIGGVSWSLHAADETALAYARADELRDVLLNVFENARLARASEVVVNLSTSEKSVSIAIDDNGAGIARGALPRVFEPHFSTRTTGSGLGLAISRRLLESWGGTIDITSQENSGTRVTIVLQTAPA